MKTGKEQLMQVQHEEGVATHFGPESWAAHRKVRGQALTGELWAEVIQPRNYQSREPTLSPLRKATLTSSSSQDVVGPGAVQEPWHAAKLPTRESGDPVTGLGELASRSAHGIRKEQA